MEKIRLGKTNLMVTRTSFGALPIQRRNTEDAIKILRRAYNAGINFFDTARAYSDSEEKIALAFPPEIRKNIIIATKTTAKNAEDFWEQLNLSLEKLNTDYIDILQFHNPEFVPYAGGSDGLYDAVMEAKNLKKIRHIGITNHRIKVAFEAVESGIYDTLQYPFSLLASEDDVRLVRLCKEKDVGFIAMKALSGGLITNAVPTFAYIRTFENIVPIWGIQHEHELEQFIQLEKNPLILDNKMQELINADRAALSTDFCRGCGYCLPCPANIEINMAARIYYFITRSPYKYFIGEEYQRQMAKVDDCINCGECRSRCPYSLDTPVLLKKQYELYKQFVKQHENEI